mmetsp:Transcript_33562/g.97704  ORF Transcript_33562/g.97704 Transcript_33562/m.97704 type:complete len:221 (-) Transcript_33562:458-1120(-)
MSWLNMPILTRKELICSFASRMTCSVEEISDDFADDILSCALTSFVSFAWASSKSFCMLSLICFKTPKISRVSAAPAPLERNAVKTSLPCAASPSSVSESWSSSFGRPLTMERSTPAAEDCKKAVADWSPSSAAIALSKPARFTRVSSEYFAKAAAASLRRDVASSRDRRASVSSLVCSSTVFCRPSSALDASESSLSNWGFRSSAAVIIAWSLPISVWQ